LVIIQSGGFYNSSNNHSKDTIMANKKKGPIKRTGAQKLKYFEIVVTTAEQGHKDWRGFAKALNASLQAAGEPNYPLIENKDGTDDNYKKLWMSLCLLKRDLIATCGDSIGLSKDTHFHPVRQPKQTKNVTMKDVLQKPEAMKLIQRVQHLAKSQTLIKQSA
jgi:hypothetical protein